MTWLSFLFGSGGAVAVVAAAVTQVGPAPMPRPEALAVETGDAAATPLLRIARSSDGLFYLKARVNGRLVRFLVDTGASVTILTPGDARAAGVTALPSPAVRLRTASGRGRIRWAELERLGIGSRELRHMDAGIGSDDLPVSLLGQNVLSRLGSVRISGNDLHLS